MKKAILNMKAFYISLFVVLFFPLGLMGQEPIYTKLEEGAIVCFESTHNKKQYIMAVNDNGGYNYTLSAKQRTNQIWSDMTIWWEVTRIDEEGELGLKSLMYDCYLKINLTGNDKYYSLTTNVSEATLLGFVDANETAKILLTLKSNADKTKATSWYVGVEQNPETKRYTFCTNWGLFSCKKSEPRDYSQVVFKYYRPQYNGSKWIAATNIAERDLHDCDVIPSDVKESDDYLSTLIEVYFGTSLRSDITSKPKISYSPKIVLGGIDFGKIEGLNIDLCKVLAFFCPPTDAQAYLLSNFNIEHQKGASGRDLDEKGLQSVHTFTEVIYAKPNDMVNLRLQVEDTKAYSEGFWDDLVNSVVDDKYLNGFYRWFIYEKEDDMDIDDMDIINSSLTHTKSVASGIFGSNVTQLPVNYLKTDKGDVLLKGMGPGRTDYKMGDNAIKIACDVSNYSDYDFTCDINNGKIVLKEPTLSYRMIYDIRPAKEMAAQLDNCTTTPLESYTIVAPVPVPIDPNKKEGKQITIGPKYRWNLTRSNYYYTSSVTKIQRPYWYKNGKRFTPADTDIIDDRLISIVGPDEDGKVDTYTLKTRDGNAIIAEFKVIGRDINKVGPSNTAIDFPDGYDPTDPSSLTPAYTETFDRSSAADFEEPLPWNNISYGFVYYDVTGTNGVFKDLNNKYKGRKGSGNKSALLSHWSEYSFVDQASTNNTDVIFNVKSKSKSYPTNALNRFLYCSGTNTPGKVADFVINGDLCPASKIFLSAWVVHTYDVDKIDENWINKMSGGTSRVYPNLNFSIIGIMNDGTETPITTFTTGDLDTKNGAISDWHHIFFEFETTQVDYDQYRIRIENNNASIYNIGNEFGIDDIRVWTTTKTAATVSQRFMSCTNWNLDTKDQIGKSNIALLRAELDNTPATGATMYYAWLKKDGVNDTISLELQNYIGQSPTSRYGTIEVNKGWWTTETAPTNLKFYDDVNDYLADIEGRTGDFSDYFFTRENNELVLYIVHKDKLFQQNEKYYSIVTTLDLSEYTTSKDLVELFQNLQCGSLSYFEVLPYSRAFLAKQEGEGENVVYKKYGDYDFTEAITKHLADGETYNFVVEAYSPAVIDGRDTIVSNNCAADWLLVNGMDEAEKWTNVDSIIKWRKGEVDKLNLGDKLTKGVISKEITMSETEPFMHYVVIPCPGSTEDEEGPCVVPFELLLYDSIPATLADPTINNNKVDTLDRPADICNEPIIVRIPNSLVGKDNFTLNLDIDYFDEYLFAEIAKYSEQEGNTNLYPWNNIYLYEYDDEKKQLVKTSINFNITTTETDENDQTLTLDLLNKDDDVTISGGHAFESGQKYHFAGHNEVNGVKITPPFQFDVYVVPDTVEWTGAEGTAWHNDANWNPAFIPMSHTNVVIPDTTNNPVLKPSASAYESGAYEWLEHDIVALTKDSTTNVLSDNLSATLNSCKDIYFEAGAQLANQHMLNYERAFVDVPFTGTNFGKSNKNFKIMSFPLRNVYRGDLYIPKDGDGTFAFANPVANVDNRAYNSFYVKAYNSAIKKNTISGDKTKPEVEKVVEVKDYTYESTGGWSNPTSVLNFEFEEAHGYAVSLNANTTQSFVRLPKSATEYYLFMNFGNGNEKELHGFTWPKYEIPELQLKGDKRIRSSEGHKLVYDKSHGASVTFENKKGNIFLIGNPFMTNMNVKEFLAGNTNLNSTVYYTYIDGTINVNVTPKETDVIPPFGAMFVKGKTNSVEQTFKFTSEMMSYIESTDPTQQRAPRMVEERELLTITAEVDGARSRTYIEKDFAANNEYIDTEDADLLVLDADLTPISVYSVATGAALAYNSVTDMEFVPLGLLLVDSTIVAESVRFTFDGVDYFYDELYLYDALYNSYLPLIDGVALELEMPESGELRYFITDTKHNVGGGVTTSDDLVEDSKVCVFTAEGEACIIAEDIISEATVYDIAGRLIYYSDQISSSQHNISLPNGVYMLKVVVNSNLSTHKIILK